MRLATRWVKSALWRPMMSRDADFGGAGDDGGGHDVRACENGHVLVDEGQA